MTETWTVQKILNWTIEYFTSKNIPESRLSAELLLASVLNCKRIELYVQFERILSLQERNAYKEYIQRRINREPVQYILGETEFMGLPIKVASGVLIPRADTEVLVDSIIEYLKEVNLSNPQILDIGTGSGCIAIALSSYFPEAEVFAIEKSPEALEIAEKNAQLNEVKIEFIEGDFFEKVPILSNRFNIIVSNPPYISEADWNKLQPEVEKFEPRQALFGGKEGLDFYRSLIPIVRNLLLPKGVVFLETGYDQARIVSDMLQQEKFDVEIRNDYNGIERVVIGK